MTKKTFMKQYADKNPIKAGLIKKSVKRGVKQYAETFRRLANT
jgi:hypothetical protein